MSHLAPPHYTPLPLGNLQESRVVLTKRWTRHVFPVRRPHWLALYVHTLNIYTVFTLFADVRQAYIHLKAKQRPTDRCL